MKRAEQIVLVPTSKEIEKWYAACNLVVFPSRDAHQALPIYEAGAAKRLMLISDFPNTQEFLRNMENGLVFCPNDADALADKILWVFRNRDSGDVEKMVSRNQEMTIRSHSDEHLHL